MNADSKSVWINTAPAIRSRSDFMGAWLSFKRRSSGPKSRSRSLLRFVALGSLVVLCGCGILPEKVAHDDPRLKPMFEAMSRVDRTKFGFTPVADDASIRIEWGPRNGYDTMLHISGRTSRTVAFRRTQSGYEWIGEQETFKGPRTYKTPDGEFNESITITFEKVPLSGHALNTVNVDYAGEDPDLAWPRQLTLGGVRPWLKRWGYS